MFILTIIPRYLNAGAIYMFSATLDNKFFIGSTGISIVFSQLILYPKKLPKSYFKVINVSPKNINISSAYNETLSSLHFLRKPTIPSASLIAQANCSSTKANSKGNRGQPYLVSHVYLNVSDSLVFTLTLAPQHSYKNFTHFIKFRPKPNSVR